MNETLDVTSSVINHFGKRVRVHMNLHNKMFNISEYIKGKGWRKLAYTGKVLLLDVEFHVSQAGNIRARESGQRNVHAYMYGELTDPTTMLYGVWEAEQVKYNPFKACTFMGERGPIHEAVWAYGEGKEVYALRKAN